MCVCANNKPSLHAETRGPFVSAPTHFGREPTDGGSRRDPRDVNIPFYSPKQSSQPSHLSPPGGDRAFWPAAQAPPGRTGSIILTFEPHLCCIIARLRQSESAAAFPVQRGRRWGHGSYLLASFSLSLALIGFLFICPGRPGT